MKMPPPGRLVQINGQAGGRRLHVDVQGSGTPVVVLESGIAASSLSWCLVQKRIAEFTTALSYDRAGFGWSDPCPGGALKTGTVLQAVRDLAAMLDRAELPEPFVLAGHSFGGLITRVFEQYYPRRVAGLVLVDPVVRSDWRDPSDLRQKMLRRGVRLSNRGALLARIGVVGFALSLLGRGSRIVPRLMARASAGRGAGVAERLAREVAKMPRELWPAIAAHWSEARCFRAMAEALENLPQSVRQIDESRMLGDLPVAVLSAASASPETMAEHAREAGRSSRGRHIVVPRTGHWLQLDAPDAVVEAVRRVIGDNLETRR